MRILTANEIKHAEELAFKNDYTPAQLMKTAGEKCFNRIIKLMGDFSGKSVCVFCGNGNNAGDGFVIASLLKSTGVDTAIVLVDKEPSIDEPLMFYNQAINKEVAVLSIDEFQNLDASWDYAIDCIFGIGFHGEASSPFSDAINIVNNLNAIVVSVDIPSGVNSTTGQAKLAVNADYTIAISTLKYGHILPPGNACCGKLFTVNIGINDEYYPKNSPLVINKNMVKAFFEKRDKNCHKGSCGHQLNICGSYLMPGAAVISAKGAMRCGAGLLKCVFPKSIYPTLTAHLTQPIFKPVCENQSKTISIGALNEVLEELDWADSVVLGCGIGNNDDTQVISSQVLKNSEKTVILDADGINSTCLFIELFKEKKCPLIITPHPAEMARLIKKDTAYVNENRISVAVDFAKEYSCIVVLKGANTIITDGNQVLVNTTGNPGLAMGGSGDLLSGMIGAFAAQGMSPFNSAAAGVYIHGLCADITANELSQRGMLIEDMTSLLGALMSEFE